MKIVVDANIFIMALMGSRGAITILTSRNHEFYVPGKIIEEIRKYKETICEKMEHSSEEFDQNLNALLMFITVLEYIEYESFMQKAREAISKRDIKDSDYIACALAINADFIWTNDKDFIDQDIVSTKNTTQFIQEGKK